MMIGNTDVAWLGDPHLGKKFVHGVPLHRRGEREKRQLDLFREKLMNPGAPVHVCVGDIFDKFIVSPSIVLYTAEAYVDAARANPNTEYFLLMGNHDGSKDATLRSSFDILEAILAGIENIHVVRGAPMSWNGMLFIPWDPFISAQFFAENLEEKHWDAIFGHWDVTDFGNENPNLLPIKELKKRTNLIITGHEHTPDDREIEGVRVIITGSMEPYSHGEDPKGEIYQTLSLEEARSANVKDKCIRVLLQPGEQLDFEVDCLQLQVKRNGVEQEEVEVDFETFDLKKMFFDTFEEFGVRFPEASTFWDRLQAQSQGIV